MRYNEFKPLTEGPVWDWIKNALSTIVGKTKSVLQKLGFGQSGEIKLSSSKQPVKEAVNQALYGYMAEYSTCYELTKLINEAGFSVSYRQGNGNLAHGESAVKLAKDFKDDYAIYVLSTAKDNEKDKAQAQIELQGRAGEDLAKAMFDDAIIPAEDVHLLKFEVIHSGESMKYETKADAVLKITKEGSNEVVDEIKASLKSYKDWQVNLNNSTIISIFKNLGITLEEDDRIFLKTGQDIRMAIFGIYRDAVKAVKDGKKYKEVYNKAKKDIIDIYGDIVWIPALDELFSEESVTSGSSLKGGPTYRAAADALQDTWKVIASDYLTRYAAILNKEYKANRESANAAFMAIMGFDNAEDFYLAVLNTSKKAESEFTVRSSRVSKEYRKLVEQFNNNLKLEFIHTVNNTASITINYYSGENELIQSTGISIGKSASMGMAKNNWFLDFKSLK